MLQPLIQPLILRTILRCENVPYVTEEETGCHRIKKTIQNRGALVLHIQLFLIPVLRGGTGPLLKCGYFAA